MTDDFAYTLLDVMNADTFTQTTRRGLHVMVTHLRPSAAVLLLWDDELDRYTVGETWLPVEDRREAAQLRRRALHLAGQAYAYDPHTARCIESGMFYQPLNLAKAHIGAYFCEGVDAMPDTTADDYALMRRCVTKALSDSSRLRQANREHTELEAERARLEELLQAVEQQQHTIDRLLTLERQFSASLEAEVAERTEALQAAQKRLLQSEKLAVIGQLASSLAHELNNPMQAIQSGLGLVMDEIADATSPHVREDLHIVQAELERIQGIFRQMLDFYRPVTYQSVPLDVNAIIDGVYVLMRKRLQESSVRLTVEPAPTLPLTCGDSNQIKQVLINLLLNAAEAMNGQGGQIVITTEADDDRVHLHVRDDGPGIAIAHQAQLFEPLFTTKTRGLGLGLAICREVVNRHNGRLTVESAPGQGATFILSLPIQEACDGSEDTRR
jgi:signal transduction histidine kinase